MTAAPLGPAPLRGDPFSSEPLPPPAVDQLVAALRTVLPEDQILCVESAGQP